jgi:hypothetical protein
MKLLHTGSDVLFSTRLLGGKNFPTKLSKYIYFLGMTIFVKLADLFVECHYVVSEHLINELKPLGLKKKIKILVDPPQSVAGIKRETHDGFNVLYYRGFGANQKYNDWVYGYDIAKKVKEFFGDDVNLIEVNGNKNMQKIYPIVDFYLRPNRHDGAPRMIMECEQLGIPYYWSKENPDINSIQNEIIKIRGAKQNIPG